MLLLSEEIGNGAPVPRKCNTITVARAFTGVIKPWDSGFENCYYMMVESTRYSRGAERDVFRYIHRAMTTPSFLRGGVPTVAGI